MSHSRHPGKIFAYFIENWNSFHNNLIAGWLWTIELSFEARYYFQSLWNFWSTSDQLSEAFRTNFFDICFDSGKLLLASFSDFWSLGDSLMDCGCPTVTQNSLSLIIRQEVCLSNFRHLSYKTLSCCFKNSKLLYMRHSSKMLFWRRTDWIRTFQNPLKIGKLGSLANTVANLYLSFHSDFSSLYFGV